MPRPRHVPIAGSERDPVEGARRVRRAPPDERVEVTVVVRPQASAPSAAELLSADAPVQQRYLTRREFARTLGADPADLERVAAFAREYGLEVLWSDAARRSVALGGSVEQMQKAFRTDLAYYESPLGAYRGRTGPVRVPAELADVVEAVLGLDDRHQSAPHFRMLPTTGDAAQPRAGSASFTPVEVAKLYDY